MPGVCNGIVRVASVSLGLFASLMVAGSIPALAHAEHGHPAIIHEGTCEELGPLAFRLNGVGGSVDLDNAPTATPTAVNPSGAYQVMISETTIDGSLADLLASDHAVMVYESDEEMTAISCGNLGGAQLADRLVTGLAEMGVAGHTGFAIFTPVGDATKVEILIGHGLAPVSAAGMETGNEQSDTHDDKPDDEHAEDESGHAEADSDHATPAS